MGFGDRFWTPTTARAILSWRIVLGLVAGAAAVLVGIPVPAAVAIALVVYAGAVLFAMPRRPAAPAIDPFSISEPWRHFVQGGQRSKRVLVETVRSTPPGPLRDRLDDIAGRLDEGLREAWAVAKRGDQIDAAIASLDPPRLRARLDTLRAQAATAPTEQTTAAVAAVERQLASADRLKKLSASTADQLRLTQARLDELVARAAEVSVGAADTERFATQVDELVVELESLHQAVQELPS